MKILMFSADPNILDVGSAAAGRMIEYGRRVEKLDILVLARKVQTKSPTINRRGNVSMYVKSGIFWRFLAGFFLARRLAAKNKYDLLVAQDIEHAFICWLLGGKWQMQFHTDVFSPCFVKHRIFNRARVILAKFLIPRASCIRVVSERIKNSVLRTSDVHLDVGRQSVMVLPILVEPADLNIEPKRFPEFDKVILMVSRLTSEKNIGLAIDAMAEVVKKYPKTGLVIVGDGPERQNLESRIWNLELQKNIKMVGWQNDTTAHYRGADIFLLTSWYEGWGMSAVEAMALGAAVVMTDVGLAGEMVEDGKTGLVVPVNDKNALVAATLRLLENEGLRLSLIDVAARKVSEFQNAENYYQKIIDGWQKCLNS